MNNSIGIRFGASGCPRMCPHINFSIGRPSSDVQCIRSDIFTHGVALLAVFVCVCVSFDKITKMLWSMERITTLRHPPWSETDFASTMSKKQRPKGWDSPTKCLRHMSPTSKSVGFVADSEKRRRPLSATSDRIVGWQSTNHCKRHRGQPRPPAYHALAALLGLRWGLQYSIEYSNPRSWNPKLWLEKLH